MCLGFLCQKTDVTYELVEELQAKTKEFLQPNPTARAKMAAVKGISKLSGQAKASTYPQPEGVLGECMVTYGRKLGEESLFGKVEHAEALILSLAPVDVQCCGYKTNPGAECIEALIQLSYMWLLCLIGIALLEMGESMKQMADVKYSLDDNIKQNFLEPLHHLQTKDLKEVMVGKEEKEGTRRGDPNPAKELAREFRTLPLTKLPTKPPPFYPHPGSHTEHRDVTPTDPALHRHQDMKAQIQHFNGIGTLEHDVTCRWLQDVPEHRSSICH
ncbi:hypothetical protein PR048_015640 [Dryococelus australis]|uniref:BAR domain-containing protein n=1 Tax=Dryococelus australis TaxID=614101 RepID=A0ABQ9HHH4_9NEOP|nr:hypothetical protein PR048_015640 [Dryococelus australis]